MKVGATRCFRVWGLRVAWGTGVRKGESWGLGQGGLNRPLTDVGFPGTWGIFSSYDADAHSKREFV